MRLGSLDCRAPGFLNPALHTVAESVALGGSCGLALASLLLILFAISRVMISQRRRCFLIQGDRPHAGLLACGHFD